MGTTSSIIAWIAFGLMAGIVAMIQPYHRGARGVFTNLGLGVAGALAGGFLGRALRLYPHVASAESFLLAVVGALAMVAGFHVWFMRAHAAHARR